MRLANTLVYASVADTKVAVTLLRGGGLLGDIVVDVYATVSIPSKPLAATALAAATAEATLASTRTKVEGGGWSSAALACSLWVLTSSFAMLCVGATDQVGHYGVTARSILIV